MLLFLLHKQTVVGSSPTGITYSSPLREHITQFLMIVVSFLIFLPLCVHTVGSYIEAQPASQEQIGSELPSLTGSVNKKT